MEIRNRNLPEETVSIVSDPTDLMRSQDSPLTRISHQWEQIRSNLQVLLSPGDNQFKDLPKRVRLMIVSFCIPLLYALIKLFVVPQNNSVLLWGIVGLVLAIITYGGIYWGLKAQVRKESYLSVLPLPSIFVFANVLFLSTTFIGEINRLYLWGLFASALAFFMIFLYMMSLAINVLNVTLYYTIPLSRLGETVAYISAIVILFLLSIATTNTLVPLVILGSWVKLGITLGCYFISVFALLSSIFRYFVPKSSGYVALLICVSIILFMTYVVLSASLPYPWLVGVILSLFGYVVLGYVIHKEQNTYKTLVIVEFWALLLAAFLALIMA